MCKRKGILGSSPLPDVSLLSPPPSPPSKQSSRCVCWGERKVLLGRGEGGDTPSLPRDFRLGKSEQVARSNYSLLAGQDTVLSREQLRARKGEDAVPEGFFSSAFSFCICVVRLEMVPILQGVYEFGGNWLCMWESKSNIDSLPL